MEIWEYEEVIDEWLESSFADYEFELDGISAYISRKLIVPFCDRNGASFYGGSGWMFMKDGKEIWNDEISRVLRIRIPGLYRDVGSILQDYILEEK